MLQKDIAELLHVSCGTVSNYECGVHLPDLQSLMILAQYFNVTTDYLLGRTSCNVSASLVSSEYIPGYQTDQLIHQMLQLSERRRSALVELVAAFSVLDLNNREKLKK